MAAPASVEVFTFRKGLLARLGHDLCLSAERFAIDLDAGKVTAEVFASSLRVLGAMHDGKLDRSALSASDRADIERAIKQEILRADRHPKLSFRGEASAISGGRFELRGELELQGKRVPQRVPVELREGALRAELELRPSSFGIEPYRALGGALKLEDRVKLQIVLPLPVELEKLAPAELAQQRAHWSLGAAA